MTEGIVDFSDWEKLDLRVGEIIEAEDMEGADKLYKLSIDLGKELGKRILVAGIKQFYAKDKLKGKKCIVFANLEPRKLKGIESKGMILAAVSKSSDGKEKVKLLQPDEDIELGSGIC